MTSKNVLLFGDTAFVGNTISNCWRDHGYQFKIYELNANMRDIWYAGMNSVTLIDSYARVISECKSVDTFFLPDIIHIHFYYKYVEQLKKYFPKAKIILSLHGSELRLNGWDTILKETNSYVDYYTVSTKDLYEMEGRPINCKLMLNAPDMIMIGPNRADKYGLDLQVQQSHGKVKTPICDQVIITQKRGWGEIYPRISYFHFLSHFSTFHDHKVVNGKTLPMSLTAIEFLAMGGIVHHKDEWIVELPEEYQYSKIMGDWDKLYKRVTTKSNLFPECDLKCKQMCMNCNLPG